MTKAAESQRRNKYTYREYYKRYYSENKPKLKLQKRNSFLKNEYGISLEEYGQILAAQDFVCAICYGNNNGRALHVDHDHKSGRVRGLLCYTCNSGLGYFKDCPDRMRRAAQYIERNQGVDD